MLQLRQEPPPRWPQDALAVRFAHRKFVAHAAISWALFGALAATLAIVGADTAMLGFAAVTALQALAATALAIPRSRPMLVADRAGLRSPAHAALVPWQDVVELRLEGYRAGGPAHRLVVDTRTRRGGIRRGIGLGDRPPYEVFDLLEARFRAAVGEVETLGSGRFGRAVRRAGRGA